MIDQRTSVKGRVVSGAGHFSSEKFKARIEQCSQVLGVTLFNGTLNVQVENKIEVKQDFRIPGVNVGEPDQDLIIERIEINSISAYRVRPFVNATGAGGHGDNIIEIMASTKLRDELGVSDGDEVELTFFRSDLF